MTEHVYIAGTGAYLPERVLTNHELAQRVETSDDWIQARTGIKQRHIAASHESTAYMACEAAKRALAAAGCAPEAVDMILVATITPDRPFPSTATAVQAALSIPTCIAFDLQAACAGFVYAMTVAEQFLLSGSVRNALVIGADVMSRLVDWTDRNTCVLFGDGAGAVLLTKEAKPIHMESRGIVARHLYADGKHDTILYANDTIVMQGKEVFRHAVEKMSETALALLAEVGMSPADLRWLVPHQANQRIMEAVAKRLGIPDISVISTVAHHANTSAASIPLALDEAARKAMLQPGDLVLLDAIGGGLCWGGCLLRW